MKIEDNCAYLVSTASFSYNDEGYTANEEGVVPLKIFLTKASAQAYAHKMLSALFSDKAYELTETLEYESISAKNYHTLTCILGDQIQACFKEKKGYGQGYFSLDRAEGLLKILKEAGQAKSFEELQEVFKVIRGVEYIQIQKFILDL